MPWVWAALMPHPPILVPEVGLGRENEARETLNGLGLLAESLRDRKPDVLLVLSPHQPYAPGALFLNSAERAMGTPQEAPQGGCRPPVRVGGPDSGGGLPRPDERSGDPCAPIFPASSLGTG